MTDPTQETTRLDIIAPPESQFSVNWQMTGKHGEPVQITMRGITLDDVLAVFVARNDFVEKALAGGWSWPNAPKSAPAAAAPAVAAPSAPVSAPASNGGGGFASKPRESFRAVKMEVTPKPDGKAELKFYAASHNFPDIYVTRSHADLVKLLAKTAPWAPENFGAANTFNIDYMVEYTLSEKLNSRGNHYKDIADIRPA